MIFSLPRATVKAKNWTVIACLGKTFILWIFLEWWPLHYSLMVGRLRICREGVDIFRGFGSSWVSKEGLSFREPLHTPSPCMADRLGRIPVYVFTVSTSPDSSAENLT